MRTGCEGMCTLQRNCVHAHMEVVRWTGSMYFVKTLQKQQQALQYWSLLSVKTPSKISKRDQSWDPHRLDIWKIRIQKFLLDSEEHWWDPKPMAPVCSELADGTLACVNDPKNFRSGIFLSCFQTLDDLQSSSLSCLLCFTLDSDPLDVADCLWLCHLILKVKLCTLVRTDVSMQASQVSQV